MENFRAELFQDPVEYEEVPLRDRKVDFPTLKKRGPPEKKAELIRAVIALAKIDANEYESAERKLRECTGGFGEQVRNLLVSLTPHDLSRSFQEEQAWRR